MKQFLHTVLLTYRRMKALFPHRKLMFSNPVSLNNQLLVLGKAKRFMHCRKEHQWPCFHHLSVGSISPWTATSPAWQTCARHCGRWCWATTAPCSGMRSMTNRSRHPVQVRDYTYVYNAGLGFYLQNTQIPAWQDVPSRMVLPQRDYRLREKPQSPLTCSRSHREGGSTRLVHRAVNSRNAPTSLFSAAL